MNCDHTWKPHDSWSPCLKQRRPWSNSKEHGNLTLNLICQMSRWTLFFVRSQSYAPMVTLRRALGVCQRLSWSRRAQSATLCLQREHHVPSLRPQGTFCIFNQLSRQQGSTREDAEKQPISTQIRVCLDNCTQIERIGFSLSSLGMATVIPLAARVAKGICREKKHYRHASCLLRLWRTRWDYVDMHSEWTFSSFVVTILSWLRWMPSWLMLRSGAKHWTLGLISAR